MSSKKKIEEIYKKKDLHQHILDRPDSYIGSTTVTTEERFVYDEKTNKIVKKVVEYNPGLIKIFDEILVNAIDHSVRDKKMTTIKVEINKEKNTISIYNDGTGVPVLKHKEYGIYIPELIFGHLLTSSNYDDTQQRIVGGRNGLGAKVTGIFSEKMIIETIDSKEKLYYKQKFSKNMYEKTEPIIKSSSDKSYTKITFTPDSKRLGILTDDTVTLLQKRVIDTTACTGKNISVYLNGNKLTEKDFIQYTKFYTSESNEQKFITESFEQKIGKETMVWDIAIKLNERYEQVSFVNGIDTYQGGKHVDYILNQVIKKLTSLITTKKKVEDIKTAYLKDRLFIIVKSTIINPSFTSQAKEYLNTNSKDFGMKIEISDKFIDKIYKSGIVEELLSFVKYKNDRALAKKAENTSRKTRINIPKLDDANFAGTVKSKNCVLMLTEGDSAKTFAVSGTSVIGRNYYGIFPLRGKLINIREATQKQLINNEEINNLKKIIGLQHGKKYNSVDTLRYGKIMILTDSDVDGIHISGLIMNFFHTWWPELLEIPGFITSMKTPIIKVQKGKISNSIEFYSQKDYELWKESLGKDISKWNIKYYKGLGTSTAVEAKELFKNFDKNKIDYIDNETEQTKNAMLLAFEKKKADDRKEWLKNYKVNYVLDYSVNKLTYDKFINERLVQFSIEDIHRSIPSLCDGLKPSQRKVLYTLFKKNYTKEIKVAQFGASVAELTAYHHGEQSLFSTIVNMAQDYTGSNNINLLKPNGQFGCLDPDTEILMFDGNIKLAKNIQKDDILVGDDGTSRKVLALTQGIDEMYEIINEDGDRFVANSKHLLTFKIKCNHVIKWNPNKMHWMFVYLDVNDNSVEMKRIPIVNTDNSPLTNNETDKFRAIIKARKMFKEIKRLYMIDITVEDYLKLDDFTKTFLFSVKNDEPLMFSQTNVIDAFKVGQLINTGYFVSIPKYYKLCNQDSRIKILVGFFGVCKEDHIYVYGNSISIYVGHLQKLVIKDLQFIVQSLGYSCKIDNQNTLFIQGDNLRKILGDKYIDFLRTNNRNEFSPYLSKITIKSLGKGQFVGWEVDKNKRFLLGNFVITHNSRLQNGKDSASPRYIFTEINDIAKKIFNSVDFKLLNYLEDDGVSIEPEYYVPTIPMILVNGCQGIGTGFSTFIPPYNPVDIIENMERMVSRKSIKKMSPYYRGFKGTITESDKENTYNVYGKYTRVGDLSLQISELPPAISIEDYKIFVNELLETTEYITDFIDNSSEHNVDIVFKFSNKAILDKFLQDPQTLYKMFKLVKPLSINNMHLFGVDGKIKKYNDVYEILTEFMDLRLKFNKKRKIYLVNSFNEELNILEAKIRFIEEIIEGTLVVYRKKKDAIIKDLKTKKYPTVDEDYNYLLSMPVYSFTVEKITELKTKIEKIKTELENISNKTVVDILSDDLKELRKMM